MARRLEYLRPVAVLFLWGIGSTFAIFAVVETPPLGSVWVGANIAGALALFALPLTHSSRLRSVLVGVGTFVALLHAEEWVRHVSWPLGAGLALLWVAVIVGLIATISADAEISLEAKVNSRQ